MKKSNMKKSNMGMNILLFFVLVGSCLGVAAFVMSLTKKSGEGYSNLTHNNTEASCLGEKEVCAAPPWEPSPPPCCGNFECKLDPYGGPPRCA